MGCRPRVWPWGRLGWRAERRRAGPGGELQHRVSLLPEGDAHPVTQDQAAEWSVGREQWGGWGTGSQGSSSHEGAMACETLQAEEP